MVSGEIEQVRVSGHPDDAIAATTADATGEPFTARLIERHYTDPARRTCGGDGDERTDPHP